MTEYRTGEAAGADGTGVVAGDAGVPAQPLGFLLSELGGYLLGLDQAPAGTKRISNLLRSRHWEHKVIDRHLWQLAARAIVIRDDSC
jgi:hypothetical protein